MQARHTYVKLTGGKGPDVRLTADVPRKKKATRGMIGDTVRGNEAGLHRAGVERLDASKPDPLVLTVVKDGVPFRTETVTSNDHVLSFHTTRARPLPAAAQRGPMIEVVSSPIWFEPLPPRPGKGCGDANHAHDECERRECK